MRQALAALFGAGFTVVACFSTGALLLARLKLELRGLERIALAFVLGAAGLHLVLFGVFAWHVAYRPVLIGCLSLPIVACLVCYMFGDNRGARLSVPDRHSCRSQLQSAARMPLHAQAHATIVSTVICGPAFVLYLSNAWAPETSPDGSGYHLGLIARYLRAHGFERITTTWYAALSQGIEMLYAPAFSIGRHSAASLVHFSFLIALTIAMAAYGHRMGRPWAGAAGAVLVFASPVFGIDAASAYIDVGLAAAVFAAFYFLELWDEQRTPGWLIAAGLAAGYACAAKYTAIAMLLYAVGFVVWRARRIQPALAIASSAAIMVVPWLVRNWLWYANPLAPFANAWFRNPHFYVFAEQEWAAWLRRYDLPNLASLPLEVTVRGFLTSGLAGPVFLLTPLALFALRDRAGRRLLAAGLVLLAPYPANVGTRFLIPCLPFFALALAMALGERPLLLSGVMLAHAVLSWPPNVRKYAPDAWMLQHAPVRAALRLESQVDYLHRVDPEYGLARMIEDLVPPGEPVLAMNGVAQAYTTRDVRVSFEAAVNLALFDTLSAGWNPATQALRSRGLRFAAPAAARRIRVIQTAQGAPPAQWYVHELRFYRDGVEVARRPGWRLRAWPNPWDVQLAFDDSPVTRWRSGEAPAAGMYLEVDFGQEERIDEFRMETSTDYGGTQFAAEAWDGGAWTHVPGQPTEQVLHPARALRRMATRELKQRGVRYLLLRPSDPGAEDIRNDPPGWGLEILAEGFGGTLYRVTP